MGGTPPTDENGGWQARDGKGYPSPESQEVDGSTEGADLPPTRILSLRPVKSTTRRQWAIAAVVGIAIVGGIGVAVGYAAGESNDEQSVGTSTPVSTTVLPSTTAAPTTVVTTVTAPTTTVDPIERARAVFDAVWPDSAKTNQIASQEAAAMAAAISDPSSAYLIAAPAQAEVNLYAGALQAFNETDLDSLGEPYASVFKDLRHADEVSLEAAKQMLTCARGCDVMSMIQLSSLATSARSAVLLKLAAILPPASP